MKTTPLLSLIAATSLALGAYSFADAPKTYQVTGPVLAMTDTVITVQKGKDRWDLAKDATTKVNGDLKVGAKVTITYTMSASQIDVKPDKAAAKADKSAKPAQ